MFQNEKLQQHLDTSSSIKSQPAVIAEWNMNIAEKISTIGNYRFRPNADPASEDGVYSIALGSFDINDADNEVKFYTDATYADVVVDGGLDNNDQPIAFIEPNEKERLLYSLEDCFQRFRPRSGINKLRYFDGGFTHYTNRQMATRPRYYMASRNDTFKYWTSYRKEDGVERGIATELFGDNQYYIHDAAPFIVYKEEVPVNRVIVKMQTHVGDTDLGPFQDGTSSFEDPFFGQQNAATPVRWKIQYLQNNNWVDAISFDESSTRLDGSPVVGPDGYVEVSYGIIIPEKYRNTFSYVASYPSETILPNSPLLGSAYLIGASDSSNGLFYIWTGEEYETFEPNYGWALAEEELSNQTHLVENLANPPRYFSETSNQDLYKEIQYIQGVRVVVETMNKQNSTFDLLEISPRLAVNLTEKVQSFSVQKSVSDLGQSGMPVGQLLASTGSLSIFDYDQSFTKNNKSSIVSNFLNSNLEFKLYEVISFVEENVPYEFYIPAKRMYADAFPEISSETRQTQITLRDRFFHFESTIAPQILIENASLSYAISLLLDSIGFANYAFLRIEGQDDPIIPYFFISPDQSVATVLQQLASSTQSAMFFDEYNNFIVMTKEYLMPSQGERETDLTLRGSLDQTKEGQLENKNTEEYLANIIELTSSENKIFNAGKINYVSRYIQKTYGSLRQASLIDRDKTWIYKPALLWEVSGEELVRSRGEEASSSSYALSAIPLNSDLSDELPQVVDGELINNIIDFGEGVYWLGRYNGYLFANGEIVKFDAVEYNVSGIGNVWVTSVRDYQSYFAQIKFNGKIYPTGRVKIYAEPNYEQVDGVTILANGPVAKHGRGQFGTEVVYHNAGLSPYWSDNTASAPVRGVDMASEYLFSDTLTEELSGVYNETTNKGRVYISVENEEKVFSVAYGDSKWIAAGNGGKFRVSEDGQNWETLSDSNIPNTVVFYSIAFGEDDSNNNLWIAAGTNTTGEDEQESFMVTSPDGVSWTEVDPGFTSSKINEISFANDIWVAVGDVSEIRISEDGSTWNQKMPLFDLNPKTITGVEQYSSVVVNSIDIGPPSIFTKNNHGFRQNDKIRFSGDNLPPEISTGQDYYAQFVTTNTFSVSETEDGELLELTSAGSGNIEVSLSGAVLVANGHGMQDNNVFHIVADDELPEGIEEKRIYYARKINNNKFGFSETFDGPLVDFSSGQVGKQHTLNRYHETNLKAASFGQKDGDEVWIVGGTNGQMSITEDFEAWTAISTGFSLTSINSISYYDNNNIWVAVGDGGKIRTSGNGTSWTSRDSKFGSTNISSVFASSNLVVAVGNSGKISTSSNGQSWTSKSSNFNADIYDVFYSSQNNDWVIVGDKLQTQYSSDGSQWVDQSTDNAGQLLFETIIPHNLEPYDYVQFFTNGTLPSDEPKEQKVFNKIENNKFYRTNHGFEGGELIKIYSSNGTFLNEVNGGIIGGETVYEVKLSARSLEESDPNFFYLRETNWTAPPPPEGVTQITRQAEVQSTENWTYNENQEPIFSYSEFFVSGMQPASRYYVTPAKLGAYTFTVAESIFDARVGNLLTAGGSQSGEHSLVLDTYPDSTKVYSISTETENPLVIETEEGHNLQLNDRIYFESKLESDGEDEYVERILPAGLKRSAEYYVHTVLSENTFTVSDVIYGNQIFPTAVSGNLEENEYLSFSKNKTNPVLNSTIHVPSISGIKGGSLVDIVSGFGELQPETRISAIRPIVEISSTIESFTFSDSGTLFNAPNHEMFSGDRVNLSTNGSLPEGISSFLTYFVERVDSDSFYITFTQGGDRIVALNEEESGTHLVNKVLSNTEKIVISPSVSSVLSKTDNPVFTDETVIGSTPSENYFNNTIKITDQPSVINFGKAGADPSNFDLARSSSRTSIIKNFLAKTSFSESEVNKFYSTQAGTIQSSALVMTGPSFRSEVGAEEDRNPIDFVSYAYKDLPSSFTHFGTRMRIVGRMSAEDRRQAAFNNINYYQAVTEDPEDLLSFSGSSGGIAVMLNPKTNIGYYYEIVALSESNVEDYSTDGIYNILFYKLVRQSGADTGEEITDSTKAIPVRLFAGATSISVDDGTMVGQFRMVNETNPSVYDLSVEYEELGNNTRRFYLYINNRIVGVVDDDNPLPVRSTAAMFIRGESRVMFENFYALKNNYSQNTVSLLDTPVKSVFGTNQIDVTESFRKYSMSGMVQSTYLSGIGTQEPPKYNIYFEEFGTIMREAAYFNIRYDKAYPALYAQISPTFNNIKGYTVAGFTPDAYGAEFLVFNHTDTAISLDETSGNYLRIQGVTFTQQNNNELTVDDYFENVSNFSNPERMEDGTVIPPNISKQDYIDIKNSRTTNGRLEFSIEAPYIQSEAEAKSLMEWIIPKVSVPRRAVGLQLFGTPQIQLGDIVKIDYTSNDGVEQVSLNDSRFVVYNIENKRDSNGPSMTVYLSEVI